MGATSDKVQGQAKEVAGIVTGDEDLEARGQGRAADRRGRGERSMRSRTVFRGSSTRSRTRSMTRPTRPRACCTTSEVRAPGAGVTQVPPGVTAPCRRPRGSRALVPVPGGAAGRFGSGLAVLGGGRWVEEEDGHERLLAWMGAEPLLPLVEPPARGGARGVVPGWCRRTTCGRRAIAASSWRVTSASCPFYALDPHRRAKAMTGFSPAHHAPAPDPGGLQLLRYGQRLRPATASR